MSKNKNTATEGFTVDYALMITTMILVILGAIMVFSSSVIMAESRWHAPYIIIFKHAIWVVLGCAAMFALSKTDFTYLQKYSKPLLITAVILLLAVLVLGRSTGGARRWLRLGFISFQPSEFAKLAVIIAVADYIDRRKSRLNKFTGMIPAILMFAIPCGLVALEPDIGTPIIIIIVSLSMLYAAGARFRNMLALVSGIVPLVVIEILRRPYRLERMKHFFASWGDMDKLSYQIEQSILALGSGGLFGKGLAKSQMKLLYLPEPHTDFIFPIIGEELGFIGALALLFLFLFLAWRGWRISMNSKNYFGAMLGLGITWLITFQAMINIGVACGLFPTKGLPLPFVSFGGTALLLNMAGVGILLNISKTRGQPSR
jgi:cell division protein FtsW